MKQHEVKYELARRIREMRRFRKLSQEIAARRAKLSRNNWSKLENAYHTPDLWTLLRVAEALQVEASDLIAREWKMPAHPRP